MAARMGDGVTQYQAYTIEVLHELIADYEQEWTLGELGILLHVISAWMFLIMACLGRMHGFEVMWTDLATLRHDIAHFKLLEDFMAVYWPIVGRLKGHNDRMGCYMIHITGEIDSEIQFFKWTHRFVDLFDKEGHTKR